MGFHGMTQCVALRQHVFGCLLEQPDGWAVQACQSRDDWSGWLTLQLRPGEEFPIP